MWLVYFALATLAFAEPDDYHTSDLELLQAKQRLLLASNPDNRTGEPGGIRARAADQEVAIAGVLDLLTPVKKGNNNLKRGFAEILPDVEGLKSMNMNALSSVRRMDRKLSSVHEKINKQLVTFSRDWQGAILKKAESDPSTFDSTFKPVSQAFVNEFKTLTNLVSSGQRQMAKDGNQLQRKNRAVQGILDKYIETVSRKMKLGKFGIDQLLNRKALPLLVGVKYATAAQIANLGKRTIDAVSKLKDEALAQSTQKGIQGMDQSSDTLKLSAQKSIANGAKSMQRALARVRSDLNKLATKQQTWVNRNFTNMDQMLISSLASIEKFRNDGKKKLTRYISDASDLSNTFKENVFETASDLNSMLADENTVVSSIKQQAKLDAQQMNLGFSGEISGLANSMRNIGTDPSKINNVQSLISGVYSRGSSQVDSGLSQTTRGSAAKLLSDASDQSGELSSIFREVSSQADSLQSDLGSKVGINNAQLDDVSLSLKRRTGEMADNAMADIDDSTAENEADRANMISRFEKGVSGMNSTLAAQLDTTNQASSKRASSIYQQTVGGSSTVISSLSRTQQDMQKQSETLGGINSRLVEIPKKALGQLDAQNEQRLQSAFSELNSLRQLSGVRGDKLSADSESAVASIVAKALASGKLNAAPTDMRNLTAQTAALNNASISYKSSIDAFEATMENALGKARDAYDSLANSASSGRALGQIVSHQQQQLANEGRVLIRGIYNQSNANDNSIAKFLVTSPRVNVDKYLGKPLLNTSIFDAKYSLTLQSELKDLSSKRAETQAGIAQFNQYLESLKTQIAGKINMDIGDVKHIAALALVRDKAVDEVRALEEEMNATIARHFKSANESIGNKTYNFYKQFQTASIVADALVQGFADYVDKIIDYENATEVQREAMQAALLKSIQDHMQNPVLNSSMNASELNRINKLVKQAMDTSDQSAEGIRKRKAAAEALVSAVGVEAAAKLQQKYQQLASNADSLSQSIQASVEEMKSDRVAGLEGSKMGLDGVSAETQLFTNRAGGLLEAQKANSKAIAAKIDELLSGGSFLTNITAEQLGAIMKSVQNSDGVYRSQLSAYQASNIDSVATFGGVIEAFANLVQRNLEMTTDFIDMMSKNYTALVKKTDALTQTPANAVKSDVKKTKDRAEAVNASLVQHQLSVKPIEEALQERLDSLNKRNDEFRASVNKQLNDFVSTIHQMDGQVASSREGGMRKLRASLSQLLNKFREDALELQAAKVERQGSLLEMESDSQIRSDMKKRIALVKRLIKDH